MSIYNNGSNVTYSGGSASSSQSDLGIQWIINGKDIVNETKDVDMTIVFKQENYSKYLKEEYDFESVEKEEQKFWDNINWDSLTNEDWDRLIKEQNLNQLEDVKKYYNWLIENNYKVDIDLVEKVEELIKNPLDANLRSLILESCGYTKYLSINFANNGVLPCKSLIRIKPTYAFRTMTKSNDLKLYYVNDSKFELLNDSVGLDSEGYYNFEITHNSEYRLVDGSLDSLDKMTEEEKQA